MIVPSFATGKKIESVTGIAIGTFDDCQKIVRLKALPFGINTIIKYLKAWKILVKS